MPAKVATDLLGHDIMALTLGEFRAATAGEPDDTIVLFEEEGQYVYATRVAAVDAEYKADSRSPVAVLRREIQLS